MELELGMRNMSQRGPLTPYRSSQPLDGAGASDVGTDISDGDYRGQCKQELCTRAAKDSIRVKTRKSIHDCKLKGIWRCLKCNEADGVSSSPSSSTYCRSCNDGLNKRCGPQHNENNSNALGATSFLEHDYHIIFTSLIACCLLLVF